MSTPPVETRVVASPALGTRLSICAGLIILAVAAYLLFVPIGIPTKEGPTFKCGTAWAPETGDFARSVCGGLNDKARLQAGVVGFAGLVVIAGGLWAFGTVRRVQSRAISDTAPAGHDDL